MVSRAANYSLVIERGDAKFDLAQIAHVGIDVMVMILIGSIAYSIFQLDCQDTILRDNIQRFVHSCGGS